MASYFSPEFMSFFKDLAANNNKEWFDNNRKVYEKEIREPFKAFISDLIQAIKAYEPELSQAPSEAIFRINRDIRFSKDKSPYKLHAGAYISSHGKKNATWPGFYIQLSPEGIMIASGVYMPDAASLADLRYFIFNHSERFRNLYLEPLFLDKFGGIKGERQKRLPVDLKEFGEKEPLVYNKQFYYEAYLEPNAYLNATFLEQCMSYYKAALPLNNFFKEIL